MTTGEVFAWVQLIVFGALLLGLFIGSCCHAFSNITLPGSEPVNDDALDAYTPDETALMTELNDKEDATV